MEIVRGEPFFGVIKQRRTSMEMGARINKLIAFIEKDDGSIFIGPEYENPLPEVSEKVVVTPETEYADNGSGGSITRFRIERAT